MATLQSAAAKLARKMAAAPAKWAANTPGGPYCENFQAFVGHPTPQACAAWAEGVRAPESAAAFSAAAAGIEARWLRGMQGVR